MKFQEIPKVDDASGFHFVGTTRTEVGAETARLSVDSIVRAVRKSMGYERVLEKCEYCGHWGAVMCECPKCGHPVDPKG